jgi:hypothetical protein
LGGTESRSSHLRKPLRWVGQHADGPPLAGTDGHEPLHDLAGILIGGEPGLDRKDLAGQLTHVDDRCVPPNIGIDLEVTVHDAVAAGDDLPPGHRGMLRYEPIGQSGGDLPDHLDQM